MPVTAAKCAERAVYGCGVWQSPAASGASGIGEPFASHAAARRHVRGRHQVRTIVGLTRVAWASKSSLQTDIVVAATLRLRALMAQQLILKCRYRPGVSDQKMRFALHQRWCRVTGNTSPAALNSRMTLPRRPARRTDQQHQVLVTPDRQQLITQQFVWQNLTTGTMTLSGGVSNHSANAQ